MTQEDKELLLKDLSARLPYKPKALVNGHLATILGIDENVVIVCIDGNDYKDETVVSMDDNGDCVKLYLRPMSSMTEEEKKEYERLFDNIHWVKSGLENIGILSIDFMECYDNDGGIKNIYNVIPIKVIDWLNAHHFDYRGLIEKGLAIKAPEGMYETK